SGPQCLPEAARKHLVVHPHSKPPARHPRLGNLEHGSPDLPAFADERVVDLEPFGGEVLAELAVGDRTADLLFPPPLVFHRVCVDRLVESTMCLAICLAVSLEIDASSRYPPGYRQFPDRALSRAAAIFEPADATDVDREDLSSVRHRSIRCACAYWDARPSSCHWRALPAL